jgi:phosphoglycolate phosphatase-like HAD superfamily hydrolase
VKDQRRLIISDMDRTLVDFTSRYLGAYRIAVREAYGIEGQPDPHKHSGYTQAAVVRMICREKGLDARTIEAGVAKSLNVLSTTVISLLEDDLRYGILPGVEQVFGELHRQGHALVLVTGTISPIAQAILSRSGLDRFFPTRACGDEAVARVELLHLAMRRAQDTYGIHPNSNNVVVIGDAITDVEAGKAVGARVVSVATGHHSARELAECGADVVLTDLGNGEAALAAILG